MRRPRARLPVIYADDAVHDMDQIANYNERTYGQRHAHSYILFLERHISELESTFLKGRTVSERPDLRYILIQKKASSNGHIAVYNYDTNCVTVLHVFHTSQYWEIELLKGTE